MKRGRSAGETTERVDVRRLLETLEAAAGAVGSAAGVAISAPFAVIDPRTRENLGENFEHVGSNLGDAVGAGGAVFGGR